MQTRIRSNHILHNGQAMCCRDKIVVMVAARINGIDREKYFSNKVKAPTVSNEKYISENWYEDQSHIQHQIYKYIYRYILI